MIRNTKFSIKTMFTASQSESFTRATQGTQREHYNSGSLLSPTVLGARPKAGDVGHNTTLAHVALLQVGWS